MIETNNSAITTGGKEDVRVLRIINDRQLEQKQQRKKNILDKKQSMNNDAENQESKQNQLNKQRSLPNYSVLLKENRLKYKPSLNKIFSANSNNASHNPHQKKSSFQIKNSQNARSFVEESDLFGSIKNIFDKQDAYLQNHKNNILKDLNLIDNMDEKNLNSINLFLKKSIALNRPLSNLSKSDHKQLIPASVQERLKYLKNISQSNSVVIDNLMQQNSSKISPLSQRDSIKHAVKSDQILDDLNKDETSNVNNQNSSKSDVWTRFILSRNKYRKDNYDYEDEISRCDRFRQKTFEALNYYTSLQLELLKHDNKQKPLLTRNPSTDKARINKN